MENKEIYPVRDYETELNHRVAFVREVLAKSGANGIVFGNSGGKDSALVGIICKKACDNTVGLIMPCGSKRNYDMDKTDAETLAIAFNIDVRVVDLSAVKEAAMSAVSSATRLNDTACVNISPRLRMTALYAVAASENRIVAGTGNRSEAHMGYFTKWGDGAFDFNPISDLTVREIYEFLTFLGAPEIIIKKAPSAGLFDGQTDEGEMGLTYDSLDDFLLTGTTNDEDEERIEKAYIKSEHKRASPPSFEEYMKRR